MRRPPDHRPGTLDAADATVVLLPGLACDEALWSDQINALSRRHRVLVSDVHTRWPDLPTMATALLDELAGPLVLVGSSMGGMLALEAARQRPGRVHAMALLGTTARADTPQQLGLRSEAIGLFEQGRVDEVLRANVPFAFHPASSRNKALVRRYLEMVRRAGAAQLIAQNRAVMARADLRAALSAMTCPALVVCGEADRLTPPACSQEIAAALPAARLEMVPTAGHLLTLEQPGWVSALLLEWLDGLKGRAALPTSA
jgi:pimeloyl-ACP methyl ester carboxylesterase